VCRCNVGIDWPRGQHFGLVLCLGIERSASASSTWPRLTSFAKCLNGSSSVGFGVTVTTEDSRFVLDGVNATDSIIGVPMLQVVKGIVPQ